MVVDHDAGEGYDASIPQNLEHYIHTQHEHTLSSAVPLPYRVSRPEGSDGIARTDSETSDRTAPLPARRLDRRHRALPVSEWTPDRAGEAHGVLCGFVASTLARASAAELLVDLLAVCSRIQIVWRAPGGAGVGRVWRWLWRTRWRSEIIDGRLGFPAARSSFLGLGWFDLIRVRRQVGIRFLGVE